MRCALRWAAYCKKGGLQGPEQKNSRPFPTANHGSAQRRQARLKGQKIQAPLEWQPLFRGRVFKKAYLPDNALFQNHVGVQGGFSRPHDGKSVFTALGIGEPFAKCDPGAGGALITAARISSQIGVSLSWIPGTTAIWATGASSRASSGSRLRRAFKSCGIPTPPQRTTGFPIAAAGELASPQHDFIAVAPFSQDFKQFRKNEGRNSFEHTSFSFVLVHGLSPLFLAARRNSCRRNRII